MVRPRPFASITVRAVLAQFEAVGLGLGLGGGGAGMLLPPPPPPQAAKAKQPVTSAADRTDDAIAVWRTR
ncbi:MAG: hypothetical protein GIW99_01095 [Candidatus Eremiobacteraeota bacterium]|nr:hypothetical protein [Candidatus Eremiobacteraeota bacterium]